MSNEVKFSTHVTTTKTEKWQLPKWIEADVVLKENYETGERWLSVTYQVNGAILTTNAREVRSLLNLKAIRAQLIEETAEQFKKDLAEHARRVEEALKFVEGATFTGYTRGN